MSKCVFSGCQNNAIYCGNHLRKNDEKKKKEGAIQELKKLLVRAKELPEDLWAVTIIEKRLLELQNESVLFSRKPKVCMELKK